jgi:arylsulfatase A-like enzyme
MGQKPNILIFYVDQQRGDSVAPYNRAITPHAAKLAKEGITFSQAYCPSPHCSPSRTTFWTGLYPSQHGVWNNVSVGNALSRGPYDGVKVWSEFFDKQDYFMISHGKWHISSYDGPFDRGFDEGSEGGKNLYDRSNLNVKPSTHEWDSYRGKEPHRKKPKTDTGLIRRSGYPDVHLYGEGNAPECLYGNTVAEGKKFLESDRAKEKAWCMHIGVGNTHDIYTPPKPFLDLYKDTEIELPKSFFEDTMHNKPTMYRRIREQVFGKLTPEQHKECIKHYLACCSYVDHQFGELMKSLESSGLEDNTIVIYLSDHGDYMGEHGLWTKGLPCFQGAYHVPTIIKWPQGQKQPGRVIDEFVSAADMAPTILELAGYEADTDFAGDSLVPFLKGEKVDGWRTEMYTQSNGNEQYGIQRSVMNRKWKLVYNGFDLDELYDLENDPEEITNVVSLPENEQVVYEMYKKLWRFAYEHDDVCINSYMPCALATHGPGILFDDEQ